MFSLERKAKEQERVAKLGERELGELRSSNQYLLERLEQVRMLLLEKIEGMESSAKNDARDGLDDILFNGVQWGASKE